MVKRKIKKTDKCKCGHLNKWHGSQNDTVCRRILPGHGSVLENQISIECGGRNDGWCPCEKFIVNSKKS